MNRRAELLTVGSLLFFIAAVVTAFFLLSEKYEMNQQGVELQIGSYQSGVIEAVQNGERLKIFVEQAAEIAAKEALVNFARSGASYTEDYETGDSDGVLADPECGTYVYNKWSTDDRFCPPLTPEQVYLNYFNDAFDILMKHYPEDLSNISYDISLDGGNSTLEIEGLLNSSFSIPIYVSEIVKGKTDSSAKVPEFEGDYRWPADITSISSCYGTRTLQRKDGLGFRQDFHDGIDLPLEPGSKVYAAGDGVVISACGLQTCSLAIDQGCTRKCSGYGNNIVLQHSANSFTRYSHLDEVLVSQGQTVNAGQFIGRSGNTGFSFGPHLDFKFYDSPDTVFVSDKAKNPLCLYPQELLDSLNSGAKSCLDKYGSPATFDKNRAEALVRNCMQIKEEAYSSGQMIAENSGPSGSSQVTGQAFGLFSTPRMEVSEVGKYYHPLDFYINITSQSDITGSSGYYSEIVDWAEDVWESCNDNPVSCIDAKKQEFNAEQDNKFEILDQCEQEKLFYSIAEEFEACLDNGRYNCICELDLMKIYDTNEYEIVFEADRIMMKEPVLTAYYPNTVASFYGVTPSDPTLPESALTLKQELDGGKRSLTLDTKFDQAEYEKLRWYKASHNKLVLVERMGGVPLCQQRKDTFLVCAESKDKVPVLDGERQAVDNVKVKFALELKDELPPAPDSDKVELIPQEESSEGLAEQVKEAALNQALKIALGPILGQLILDVIPGARQASFQMVVDLPEDADISAFEVYCGMGTPLGDLGAGSSIGVVSLDNPYELNRTGIMGSLGVDEKELLEDAGITDASKSCGYVRVAEKDGKQVMKKEIKAFQAGNKVMFNLDSCGGNPLQQLAATASQSYCYKLVPIDSRGQRNEAGAVTKCSSFEPIQDRILEVLGLQDIAKPYIEVIDRTGSAVDAIRSGNIQDIWEFAGLPEDGVAATIRDIGLSGNVREAIMDEAIGRAKDEVGFEDYKQVLEDMNEQMGIEEKMEIIDKIAHSNPRDLIVNEENADRIIQELGIEGQKEMIQDVSSRIDEIRPATRDFLEGKMLDAVKNIPDEARQEVIERSMEESYAAKRRVERLRDRNLDRGLENLNEMGLTREQTEMIIEEAASGQMGDAAMNAAWDASLDHIEDTETGRIARQVMDEGITNFDDIIVEEISQRTMNLGAEAKAKLFENTILDEGMSELIVDGMDIDMKAELYSLFSNKFSDAVEEATGFGLDSIRGGLSCAADPIQNYLQKVE